MHIRDGKRGTRDMARLIDADALFAEFENVDWYNNADRDEIAERLVLQAPTIDAVEVVHGKWKAKSFHEVYCDNCGFDFDIMKCDFMERMNFCPNCGANMKGAYDETN